MAMTCVPRAADRVTVEAGLTMAPADRAGAAVDREISKLVVAADLVAPADRAGAALT
jgi:hypothetical protein